MFSFAWRGRGESGLGSGRRLSLTGVVTAVLATGFAVLPAERGLAADAAAGNPLEGITLSGLAYFDYSYGKSPKPGDQEGTLDRFALTRGYFTIKKQVNDWLAARITMDLSQNEAGDYFRREKYYYAEVKAGDAGFFTNLKAEIGMGHMPWLDFEEHINPYRCQGTMAVERAGIFNSADLGIGLMGYLGGKLDDPEGKTGAANYPGRYGSWHVGVYNGGGYHAIEYNGNKAVEARATLRLLPDLAPGLQISYLGIFGQGNAKTPAGGRVPDYFVNLGMLSYEHPSISATAQVFTTDGNAKGTLVDAAGRELETLGWSLFANYYLPGTARKWALFGRYDHFDPDSEDRIVTGGTKAAYDMMVGGVAYRLPKGGLIVVDFETTDYEEHASGKGGVPSTDPTKSGLGDDWKVQVVHQIAF